MTPFRILLLLFLLIPLLEIYLLIEIGEIIGAIPTVFLVVFTAVLGVQLLRFQGVTTMRRVQAALNRGEVPAIEMLEGMALLVGGALLLTPGFATDTLGFLCLVPAFRRWVITHLLLRHLIVPPGGGPRPRHPEEKGPKTLEGEFKREDDEDSQG